MSNKRGLGKGLDALLMGSSIPKTSKISLTPETRVLQSTHSAAPSVAPPSLHTTAAILELPINTLMPGQYQPRRTLQPSDLEALTDSIRSQGIIQPIVVRALKEGKYEIIAGERRWRAAQLAGLETVPVLVKNVKDEAAMVMALIENIQRADLSPLEEAMAYERLAKEFGLTHIQVAEAVGKPRTTITNFLRLLTLTDEVKALLEKGEIEVGHAKALLGLRGHLQSKFAQIVAQKGLSVRETERLVNSELENTSGDVFSKKRSVDPNVHHLQQNLSEKLGAKVEILHGQQGKGKIAIHYNSLDELDGILEHIQ